MRGEGCRDEERDFRPSGVASIRIGRAEGDGGGRRLEVGLP